MAAKKKPAAEAAPRVKNTSSSPFKGYALGFLAGVISTVLFFYFGGWDFLAREGDKVERRVKNSVDDAGGSAREKADEWIDSNFKK